MSWESWKPWWAAHGSGHSAASHWGGQFLGTNLVRGWLGLRDRPGSREMQRCGWARCQGYQHQKKRIVSGRGRVGDRWWGLARSNGSDAAYPCFHVVIAQAIRIKGLIGRIWQNPAGRPSPSPGRPRTIQTAPVVVGRDAVIFSRRRGKREAKLRRSGPAAGQSNPKIPPRMPATERPGDEGDRQRNRQRAIVSSILPGAQGQSAGGHQRTTRQEEMYG